MARYANDYIIYNLNSNNIKKRLPIRQFVFKSETSVALYSEKILSIFNNYIF